MAAIKLTIIGANPANVEEIKNVVWASIGGIAEISSATVNNYREFTDADLYVCLINREQEVIAAFGAEKVIALTLIPPTEYFLELSRIPAGTSVALFNNSTSGVRALLERLQQYGLTHIAYEVIPYDEWPEQQVIEKLMQAKYIIGGIAYVGPSRTLYTQYGKYLSPEVKVLSSPPRIATSDSISRLCHAVSSMYHRKIMGELERLAAVDFLTEIPNRRTFVESLEREWRRASREQQSLTLAIIDVDFFKKYNDYYGHMAGDQCLKTIARMVKESMKRPADFCARYGGEEFAIILPNTGLAGARYILEQIRSNVKQLAIEHAYSPIDTVVTVSAGIAVTMPAEYDAGAEALLKKADELLYKAKNSGRNRTEACECCSD